MSIIDVGAGWSVFVVDTLTVDSRVAFRLWDESSSGWGRGLCTGYTSTRLTLKMQDGLMHEGGKGGGGRICRTLWYIYEAYMSPTEAKCYILSKSVMLSKYAIE